MRLLYRAQAWYEAGGVISQAAILLVGSSVVTDALRVLQPLYLFNRYVRGRFASSQIKLNQLWAPPQMNLAGLYAETYKILAIGLIYAPAYPPAYALTALALVSSFASTRFAISRWFMRPPLVDGGLMKRLRLACVGLLLVSIGVASVTGMRAGSDGDARVLRQALPALLVSLLVWLALFACAPVLSRTRYFSTRFKLDALSAGRSERLAASHQRRLSVSRRESSRLSAVRRESSRLSAVRRESAAAASVVSAAAAAASSAADGDGVAITADGALPRDWKLPQSSIRYDEVTPRLGMLIERYECPAASRTKTPRHLEEAAFRQGFTGGFVDAGSAAPVESVARPSRARRRTHHASAASPPSAAVPPSQAVAPLPSPDAASLDVDVGAGGDGSAAGSGDAAAGGAAGSAPGGAADGVAGTAATTTSARTPVSLLKRARVADDRDDGALFSPIAPAAPPPQRKGCLNGGGSANSTRSAARAGRRSSPYSADPVIRHLNGALDALSQILVDLGGAEMQTDVCGESDLSVVKAHTASSSSSGTAAATPTAVRARVPATPTCMSSRGGATPSGSVDGSTPPAWWPRRLFGSMRRSRAR